MSEIQDEAFARGIDRGWDAASRGAEPGSVTGLGESVAVELYRRAEEGFLSFVNGFTVGFYRFGRGELQDGTPREVPESWKQHALA